MCHHRNCYNKINCLHARCLHIIYNDSASSFEDLIDKKDRNLNACHKSADPGNRKKCLRHQKT